MSANRFMQYRGNTLTRLSKAFLQLFGLIASVIMLLHSGAGKSAATNYDLNVTNQNWTTGTNWNPNGIPTTGDSVIIDLNVTVSNPQSFGSGSVNSSITGAALPAITINPGQTLTHVTGSTLLTNATTYFGISNTGTLINQGTILNSAPRFLIGYPAAGSTLSNQGGTFEFTANGAGLELIQAGGTFVNQTGGTVRVNLGAPTDVARIYGGADITGQFLQSGGNDIEFVQGTLVFAPPGGIGGPLNDTTFDALFDTINANSSLRLSGGLPSISLSGSTDLTRVTLADPTNALRAVAGGTTINITNPNGMKFSPGNSQVVIPAGRTLTNVSGSKLISTTASSFVAVSESGTFINQGTLELQNRFILGYPTGGTTLENTGLVEFTQNGSLLEFLQVNSSFKNLPGGMVRVNLPSAANTARIYSSTLDNNGIYQNLGGNQIDFVQGTLIFAPWTVTGGTLTDAEFANLFGPINANSAMQLGGAYNINLTGATDVTRVTLGGVAGYNYRAQLSGTTISATGPNGLNFTHTGTVEIGSGRTITNLAGSTLVNLAGQENYFSGAGTFLNQGTMKIGNRLLMGYTVGGTDLNNSGVVSFTNNGARVELYQNGTSFNNLADGKISVALPNATDLARVFQNSGSVSFSNLGTIEVTKGIFRVDTGVTVPSWTANTLIDGTYRVIANGNNSTLDLVAGGTSAGSFTTIGSNAKVVLSSTGANVATFAQLGSITNLQGELYVHGTKALAVGASPLNVSGTLGGDGTYNPTDSIVFSGGVLDPSSLAGGAGTLTINGNLALSNTTQLDFALDTPGVVGSGVNDLVVVNGDLTLNGALNIEALSNFGVGSYRLFEYTGSLIDNGVVVDDPNYIIDIGTFGQVNLLVLPVPEPSTGWLLLVGLAALRRRKRS